MNDSVKITSGTFPKDVFEALAFEYVKNQDLTGKSPKEIYEMYKAAKSEMLSKTE